MAVSYKKLWKMLIDKDMKKKDLCAKAGISTAMDCGVDDIMEIVLDESEKIEKR